MVGYARVSKADGSQSLDLQTDALIKADVEANRIRNKNRIYFTNSINLSVWLL